MARVALCTPISIDEAIAWSAEIPAAFGMRYPSTRLIAQKRPAARPTSAKYPLTCSLWSTRMPITSTARITAEPIRTGRSIRPANRGLR